MKATIYVLHTICIIYHLNDVLYRIQPPSATGCMHPVAVLPKMPQCRFCWEQFPKCPRAWTRLPFYIWIHFTYGSILHMSLSFYIRIHLEAKHVPFTKYQEHTLITVISKHSCSPKTGPVQIISTGWQAPHISCHPQIRGWRASPD